MKRLEAYDVVVVGSGGAGLRAGIGALENNARTLILSKGKINRSGATLLAGANISADISCDGQSMYKLGISDHNKKDSKEIFFNDLIHEGFYINNSELVRLYVDTAPNRIKELIDWGMPVRGIEGDRGIAVYGSDILDSLYKRAKGLGASFLEDILFTDLVIENNTVCGIVCIDIIDGDIIFIPSKSVIIATGGAHNIFQHNSGSTDLCGEGQAASLRAGAELIDMEMISFCPTVVVHPSMYSGNILPYIFMSLGFAKLFNRTGNTFTDKYMSREVEKLALDTEWNKMLLSYAIQREIDNGFGNIHGGVYCAINNYPKNILQEMYDLLPGLKIGIFKDMMETVNKNEAFIVSPAAHYFEGGIRIDENMGTNIKGVFAAGECTGGLFGANRVSAATTEMLIEGEKAGESAALYSHESYFKKTNRDTLDSIELELLKPFKNKNDLSSIEVIKDMHEVSKNSLGVIRNKGKLTSGYETIQDLLLNKLPHISLTSNNRTYNSEWIDYLALRNMLLLTGAILKSALTRKESRGVHIREDYFYTDNDNFLKNIIIKDTNFNVDLINSDCYIKPKSGRFEYTRYIEDVVNKLDRE